MADSASSQVKFNCLYVGIHIRPYFVLCCKTCGVPLCQKFKEFGSAQ